MKSLKRKEKMPPQQMSMIAILLELRTLFKPVNGEKPAHNGSKERADQLLEELKSRPSWWLW